MFMVYGDDNSKLKRKSVVVPAIVTFTVIVYIFQLLAWEKVVMGCSVIPYEIVNGVDLVGETKISFNGKEETITHVAAPISVFLTLVFHMFLHGNVVHIAGNMLYLLVFGDQIEDQLGRAKFLLFYLITGVLAAFAQIVFHPSSQIPSLGASGAIAGVLGAYLYLHPTNELSVMVFFSSYKLQAWKVLSLWFVMQAIGPFTGTVGVAYMAHVGGFVAGLLLLVGYLKIESLLASSLTERKEQG